MLVAWFIIAIYKGFNPLLDIKPSESVNQIIGRILGALFMPATGLLFFYLSGKEK